jgi:hypothetical protein
VHFETVVVVGIEDDKQAPSRDKVSSHTLLCSVSSSSSSSLNEQLRKAIFGKIALLLLFPPLHLLVGKPEIAAGVLKSCYPRTNSDLFQTELTTHT